MLAQLRENSRSLIIWVLFGIIIAFFVISFGPQASQDQFSCGARSPYVASVDGRDISEHSWRFAMNGLNLGTGSGARARAARARETVMDALIERELFAQLAEDSGFRIPDNLVEHKIADGDVFLLGRALPGDQIYFDENGAFDYDRLRAYSQALGLPSVNHFAEQQKRELLAEYGRQQLLSAARVSPEEVLARYRQQNTTVTADFVKWDPRVYERGLSLTDEQIQQYLSSHEQEVKDKYTADERTYKNVSEQVEARHIFVARENPPPPPAPEGGDNGAALQDPTLDPGHARASAARQRILGGESFAAVARSLSEDPRTKDKGGYLGWRSATSIVGGPEVSAAAKDLPDGKVSEVITTPRGFYVLLIEKRRSGDLSFDDVKMEIAAKLAAKFFATEGARQDAHAALAKLKESGAKLADQFERQAAPAAPATGQPNVIELGPPSDDGAGGKQGRILWEGPNVPASLDAKKKKSTDDDAVGGADDAVPVPIDVPRPANLEEPKLQTTGAMTRSGPVLSGPSGYIGRSPELATALFDELEIGQLGPRVYEADDAFVIVELTARAEPDMEQYDKQKDTLYQSFVREKNQRMLDGWALERCRVVATAGEISVNAAYVTYSDPDTGDPLPNTYKVCSPPASLGMGMGLE